ncbi:MAG: RnfABCDGE type electron transport complex subunit D, partial [Thiogranum sp.]
MRALRRYLDRIEPLFARGGRFAKYNALYEMVDTLLYTPSDVTRSPPHVRDAMDLKRLMIFVVIAVTPCLLVGMYNTGYQANAVMQTLGLSSAGGWRGAVLEGLGVGYDPVSVTASLMHGLL